MSTDQGKALLQVIMCADLMSAGQKGGTRGGGSAGEAEQPVIEEVTPPPVMSALQLKSKGQ